MKSQKKYMFAGAVLFLGLMALLVAVDDTNGQAPVPVQYLNNVGPEGTMFVDCSYTRAEIVAAVDAKLKELGK